MTLHPIIDGEIFALRPDFMALSVYVSGGRNGPSDAASEAFTVPGACLIRALGSVTASQLLGMRWRGPTPALLIRWRVSWRVSWRGR